MATHRKRRRPRRRVLPRLLLILLAAVLILWGNTALQVTERDLTFSDLPEGFEGLRIVQLSDLHDREFGKGNARLYEAVANAEPDVILLTGDLVDRSSEDPVGYAAQVGEGLTAIAPVYYVTGNHEWAHGNAVVEDLKAALRETGVAVLSNESVPLERNGDTLYIAGLDDPNGYADQKAPAEVAAELYRAHGDAFWLLLAHRNNLFNGHYCHLGADLTFSGHAHGGIWRLPFTDGLLDTNLNLLPSFTSGLYRCDDEGCEGASVFVSRGLGNSPKWAIRLFNRPEVAVLTLHKG